jgi:plastocyanin
MWRFVPALCACAAALGGCRGEDDAPTRTVEVGAGERVRVTATEYSFDPGGLVLNGGGRLRITLDNRGNLAHNVKVFDDGREIGGTASFPGGGQRSATVNVRPGNYRLVCTVGDHEALGMTGTLEVR